MYPAEEEIIRFIPEPPGPGCSVSMSLRTAGVGVSGSVPAELLLSCPRHAEDQDVKRHLTGGRRGILPTGAWVTGDPPPPPSLHGAAVRPGFHQGGVLPPAQL